MTDTGDDRDRDVGGPMWWERCRSAVLDVGLAVVSAAECGLQGADFAARAGVPAAPTVLAGLAVGALLAVRRRWPVAVVLVSIAVTPAEMGYLLGIVSLYTLAASEVPRRITALLTGMQAVGVVVTMLLRLHQSLAGAPELSASAWFMPAFSVMVALALTVPPVLLGLYAGARRRLVESLRERADGLERELALLADRAEERAEWARSEERTRIAREMHDVVAHRVSLMVVHSAALQAVALKDPEKASKNAALVGEMGRQALTELRTMLGVLRVQEGEDECPPGAGAGGVPGRLAEFAAVVAGSARSAGRQMEDERDGREGESEREAWAVRAESAVAGGSSRTRAGAGEAPSSTGRGPDAAGPGARGAAASAAVAGREGPSLAGLDSLLGQSRAAGMPVDLSVSGELRPYPAQVERTAYRVVQEALTNVHKHASGARTRVRLAHRDDEVAVQVENDCPDGAEGIADAGLPSGGNGLLGMRERVTALGGGFVSGPTDGGGFRVSAVIPAGRAG